MEKMVIIGCPTCGRQYRFDTVRFGRKGVRVRCRECSTVMRVEIPLSGEEFKTVENAPESSDVDEPRSEPEHPGTLRGQWPGNGSAPRHLALVADRDEALRAIIAATLEDKGYQVEAVGHGDEAREVCTSRKPVVAYLNAFLPGLLGVTLCAQIKRHPELASIHVVLVGSQYRRNRFVRNPQDLYGADAFLDGSGSDDEIRQGVGASLACLKFAGDSRSVSEGSTREDLVRLARIVVGDIILYNPGTAEKEILAGRFFATFKAEIHEGEALVAERFPSVAGGCELFHETIKLAIQQYGVAAGLPVALGR